jgi:AcrR family transcriptional regulator
MLRPAEELVTRAQSTELTLGDIAQAAGVAPATLALFFRHSSTYFVEAALDLARTEILSPYLDNHPPTSGPSTSAFAQHFHRHRDFYIVMQSSSCAPALNAAFDDLFRYFNAISVRAVLGPNAPEARVDAVSAAITATARATVREWLFDTAADPTAEALYMRLEKVMSDRISKGSPHAANTAEE